MEIERIQVLCENLGLDNEIELSSLPYSEQISPTAIDSAVSTIFVRSSANPPGNSHILNALVELQQMLEVIKNCRLLIVNEINTYNVICSWCINVYSQKTLNLEENILLTHMSRDFLLELFQKACNLNDESIELGGNLSNDIKQLIHKIGELILIDNIILEYDNFESSVDRYFELNSEFTTQELDKIDSIIKKLNEVKIEFSNESWLVELIKKCAEFWQIKNGRILFLRVRNSLILFI